MTAESTVDLDKRIEKAWSLSLSDQPTAIALYTQALEASEQTGYRKGIGRCLLGLGRVYCFQRRLDESTEHLEKALPILQELEDHVGVAYVYSYTAGNYLYLPVPPFETAHAFMLKALEMAERAHDMEATVRILLNLGEVQQEWGHHEDALASFKRIGDTFDQHKNLEITYLAYGYTGKVLHQLQRYDEAIQEFEKSIAGSREIGRTVLQIEILSALGESLIAAGRFQEARERLGEAIALGEPIGERSHSTKAALSLARLEMENGDMAAADPLLHRALEHSEILKAPDLMSRSLSALSSLCERNGDPATALTYLKRYHDVYLSIQQNDLQEKARARDYALKLQQEKDEIEAQHRGNQIRSLVLPMIDSIEQTDRAIQEKASVIAHLSELADESHRKLETSNTIINRVSSDVDQMVGMVDMINEISATVNLLALNAKIESAHAGKFGKRFAVIAGEIAKLSDTTQAQAEGISKTLDAVIAGARHSSVASREGYATFQNMDQAMSEVRTFLQELSGQMSELNTNSLGILEVMQDSATPSQS